MELKTEDAHPFPHIFPHMQRRRSPRVVQHRTSILHVQKNQTVPPTTVSRPQTAALIPCRRSIVPCVLSCIYNCCYTLTFMTPHLMSMSMT